MTTFSPKIAMETQTLVPAEKIFAKYPESVRRLVNHLVLKRAHDSRGESLFVAQHILTIVPAPLILEDAKGESMAYLVRVPGETNKRTLFTAHVDSVDNTTQSNSLLPVRKIYYDTEAHHLCTNGTCILSADDGTGVWILKEMIARGIPGDYIFFRGEEVSGIGSTWFARQPECKEYDRAIALDRKATYSVITEQLGGQCCSDEFADALSEVLSQEIDSDYFFGPDNSGTFTDTAMLTEVISECTNLSVGYYAQHTTNESQNVPFALAMLEAMCKIDFGMLPTKRDPNSYADDGWIDQFYSARNYSKTPPYMALLVKDKPISELTEAELYTYILKNDLNKITREVFALVVQFNKEKAKSAKLDKQLTNSKARLARKSAMLSNLKGSNHEAEKAEGVELSGKASGKRSNRTASKSKGAAKAAG